MMINDEGFNDDDITHTNSSYTITLLFYHHVQLRLLQQIQYGNNTTIIITDE
jgi:hypothetical protein